MAIRHIVALGGGGFLMEPGNPLLDDFTLALTRKRRPKVCLLATASGDSLSYVDRFYSAFPPSRCAATHLALFRRESEVRSPRETLLDQDVIYVGGGNTANALAVWRLHGVDKALRAAWQRGVVLTGVSAGMNCWFEASITDSFGPGLAALEDGLGLLAGSACPHYDGEERRRPVYHRLLAGGLPGGFAADDGAALHFDGKRLVEVVSSRPTALAYRVRSVDGRVVETPLPTRYLGSTRR